MSGNVETPIETGQKVILSKQNIDDKHNNFSYLSNTYFNSLQLCQSQCLSVSKSLTRFLGYSIDLQVILHIIWYII